MITCWKYNKQSCFCYNTLLEWCSLWCCWNSSFNVDISFRSAQKYEIVIMKFFQQYYNGSHGNVVSMILFSLWKDQPLTCSAFNWIFVVHIEHWGEGNESHGWWGWWCLKHRPFTSSLFCSSDVLSDLSHPVQNVFLMEVCWSKECNSWR